ncbi:ATP-binding protein [Streptomyces sp. TRM49041]|uniref:ATP-binding protein n=1 Tax=Streptomyces sp. TRM49041 TaxID=2603216 RepID=UPI0011EF74C0|nr:ATP-binding protein [Streptomyces sp. TRM49041]
MKQSAAKTIGVAALGAAFAASAAGNAAALTALPSGAALETPTKTLPVEQVTSQLPGGLGEAATLTQGALETVGSAAPEVPVDTPVAPVVGLLGGLPVGGGLPVTGLG